MKIFLISAISLSILVGCKQNNPKDRAQKNDHATETTDVHTSTVENNDWVNKIKLDNGAKWNANEETTDGVKKMLNLIDTANLKTVSDYKELAVSLNDEKNYIVKKCTMKGASHDNLHVFLLPLIEKIDALGKIETISKGSEITQSLVENLQKYDAYFI